MRPSPARRHPVATSSATECRATHNQGRQDEKGGPGTAENMVAYHLGNAAKVAPPAVSSQIFVTVLGADGAPPGARHDTLLGNEGEEHTDAEVEAPRISRPPERRRE